MVLSRLRNAASRSYQLSPISGKWLLDAIGICLCIGGLIATWIELREPIAPYDEGLLLTHSQLILDGKIPYRDFYSNYPPAIFLTIVGLWKLLGISPLIVRMLGVAVHLLIAGLGGFLAARVASRRFSFLTAGALLVWIAPLGTIPFAWLAGLTVALAVCFLWMSAATLQRRFAASVLMGIIGCYRHDLFLYFLAALALPDLLYCIVKRRHQRFSQIISVNAWSALGIITPLALLWIPTFLVAGFHQVYTDLYSDQVHYVLPARLLPFPHFFSLMPVDHLPFPVPRLLGSPHSAGIAFAGPVVGVMLFLRSIDPGRATAYMLTALSVAVLPQMMGRSDTFHTLYSICPSLILIAVLAELLVAKQKAFLLIGFILATWLIFPVRDVLIPWEPATASPWQSEFPRYAGLPETIQDRQYVLGFIRANTVPGEPVYIGLRDHRRVLMSEIDLYFLADRPGATRYLQFDPNVINREDVQQQMIREIQSKNVRVAVLSGRFENFHEPNQSSVSGSRALDDFLSKNFHEAHDFGFYRLLLRKGEEDRYARKVEPGQGKGLQILASAGSAETMPPGFVSLYRIAAAADGAEESGDTDLFDIARDGNLFREGEAEKHMASLKDLEAQADQKQGYKKTFHLGLVHLARLMLLPQLAGQRNSRDWILGFPCEEFRSELQAAVAFLNQSTEIAKGIRSQLEKLRREIDRDKNGVLSDSEIRALLKEKYRH